MNIFFLQGDYPFCYYFRGYLPGIYSNQTVVREFLRKDGDISNARIHEKALLADVICFQRPTSDPSLGLARLLKQRGKKIIFDNDDSYSGVPLDRLGNEKKVEIAKKLNKNLNDFIKIADGITTSTEFLAKEYRQINPNVAVLKNCIDPLDEYPCRKNITGKFRIGIIGSVTTNDDCNHIRDQIQRLHDRNDVKLVILGVKLPDGKVMPGLQEDYDYWNSLPNIEWHPNVYVTDYYSAIADLALDLSIIPRKDHYFNKCKSNLKFLDMSLLHIPVLAQGFPDGLSPYQGVDESYMTIINDNTTWYDKIIEIKDNYKEYKDLADKAHDYILKEYNIATYANTWTEEIKKLIYKI